MEECSFVIDEYTKTVIEVKVDQNEREEEKRGLSPSNSNVSV